MTLTAFLLDDEPPARARLRHLLSEIGDVLVVDESGDALEAHEVLQRRDASADEICRALLEMTRQHRGGAPAEDDVTVMVLKRSCESSS